MKVAPFHVVIFPVNPNDKKSMQVCFELYTKLTSQGIEVIYDDRDERAGVKFKDADLIGFPIRVIVSERMVEEGTVEIKRRHEKRCTEVKIDEAIDKIRQMVREEDG